MNQTSGSTVTDSSGNGNTGALINGAWASGAYGAMLSLGGNGSYVAVNESPSFEMSNNLTVSFWVYANSSSNSDPRVISKNYDWDVKLNGDSHPQFDLDTGQYAELNYSLPKQAWHHIAFTFSVGAVTGYVDGAAVSFSANTFASGNTLGTYQYGLNIGTDPSATDTLDGDLMDVRVYNRALTGAEIAALYAAAK
jgi:hypothetical protein